MAPDVRLGKEGHADGSGGALQLQLVVLEVDDALVPLQHVQAEQELHVVLLQHGEGAVEVHAADAQLRQVHLANDLGAANAHGLALEPPVH